MTSSPEDDVGRTWTFLSNHAHTLICITQDPSIRMQDIADRVGITLRAAQGIVGDLVDAGYLSRTRVGRRNRYEVHPDLPFRHPIEWGHQVSKMLAVLVPPAERAPKPPTLARAPDDVQASVELRNDGPL